MIEQLQTTIRFIALKAISILLVLVICATASHADSGWIMGKNWKYIYQYGEINEDTVDNMERGLYLAERAGTKVDTIYLKSPGGSVRAAYQIIEMINKNNIRVVVRSMNECHSACFLIFAGSKRRFAEPSAKLGVHWASVNGDWKPGVSATGKMIEEFMRWGVPESVVDKLIFTGEEIKLLNRFEIRLMSNDASRHHFDN
ncbi:ATP-dependent Clp protease proteolytic subunit [Bosea sp. PAMC 26642]|uniref:ATP-dependent Clp protease proteolytic subunit n=1 Tax=Bosea sp. (strain PAMC 26642) TaxID=1792307 RepID=UPI0009E90F1E|nr:ATP-dependent Clp protease proteolytic subunit [Bosea sp. PAMC 26642]